MEKKDTKPESPSGWKKFLKEFFGDREGKIPYWNQYTRWTLCLIIPVIVILVIFMEWWL
jgi:hypothetical protein